MHLLHQVSIELGVELVSLRGSHALDAVFGLEARFRLFILNDSHHCFLEFFFQNMVLIGNIEIVQKAVSTVLSRLFQLLLTRPRLFLSVQLV